jgi:hypothetical protein
MTDDFDPDSFDPDTFDEKAFAPPAQDGGIAQAEALAAEVRKGASSMVAVASRIEATLISFEERSTARDKAIMQRVVDPEALNQTAAQGAMQGALKAVGGKLDHVLASINSQIATVDQKRNDWLAKSSHAATELRQSAFAVGDHWEYRRDQWKNIAMALSLGCLLGMGGMFWLNRMAAHDAYQQGGMDNRRYLLENPKEFKRLKTEWDKNSEPER